MSAIEPPPENELPPVYALLAAAINNRTALNWLEPGGHWSTTLQFGPADTDVFTVTVQRANDPNAIERPTLAVVRDGQIEEHTA